MPVTSSACSSFSHLLHSTIRKYGFRRTELQSHKRYLKAPASNFLTSVLALSTEHIFVSSCLLKTMHSCATGKAISLKTVCLHATLIFFVYALCGWDGSVADAALWRDAVTNDITVPHNRYLLGDAGFPSCDALLVPYRGVCYHLREWREGTHGYVIH